jgi:hypothetical protein
VEALERVTAALEDWRPAMEGTVDDIRVEVGKISKHWERAVRERSPPILPTMPSSSTPPSSTLPASAYVLPCNTRKFHHNKILLATWFGFISLRI